MAAHPGAQAAPYPTDGASLIVPQPEKSEHLAPGHPAPEHLASGTIDPRQLWRPVLRRILRNLTSDQITLAAAGCAFYATLSLFPAISTLISIYGLVLDPDTVEPQLDLLRHLLPPAAFTLIGERIHTLAAEPHSSLTLNLIISTSIALWSASAATRSIISAVNIAYGTTETRGFIRFQMVAIGMTLCAICGAVLTLAVMVALPVLINFLPERLGLAPPPWSVELLVQMGGPILLLLFVLVACTLLYRLGPSRPAVPWRHILPGSCAATLIWIVTSLGVSYYIGTIAPYNATYGPLGAVAATMMWFFVTAYVIMLGAELNAGLEAEMARARAAKGPEPTPASPP
ncbi:YihY/virulence factor BrkB family protein [Gluconacetobacter sp. 1b LMG 1731]|uniref:YihY/virulence factor BrkB family protein n=1 Tax=Gluconacetobacter dulcium TaxID=2729096 RepID=A0A7W4IM65_9PROT|nr:YihY/virulence factor BrkB family protein [Gluconacetobacter dulcium]MBB2165445.1 YihY/virulence factor BrkB family protein [Gluconacetobacter dulcium]MBB2194581.1 YihY/virulence factor BrkB family protein [Gluconacetobacter dulcium]